jgi:hypothetical protein
MVLKAKNIINVHDELQNDSSLVNKLTLQFEAMHVFDSDTAFF